jgi:hypothetical protein
MLSLVRPLLRPCSVCNNLNLTVLIAGYLGTNSTTEQDSEYSRVRLKWRMYGHWAFPLIWSWNGLSYYIVDNQSIPRSRGPPTAVSSRPWISCSAHNTCSVLLLREYPEFSRLLHAYIPAAPAISGHINQRLSFHYGEPASRSPDVFLLYSPVYKRYL